MLKTLTSHGDSAAVLDPQRPVGLGRPLKLRREDTWIFGNTLALTLFAGLGVLVTWDAWSDIARIAWKDEESSQVLLAPVIALWLVWVRQGRLRRCRPIGQWYGAAILALGALFYFIGDLRLIQSMWHAGAILVLLGCLVCVLGKDVLFQLSPAVAVLVFMVPVPGRVRQPIAIPMEVITAQAAQFCCEIVGMPVERLGNILTINGEQVKIAEACNGLRMVFALTLVSYAFAFSSPLRGYVRLLVLALSPVLAVACNVLRLVPTVWFFGYHKAVADQFHDISGWLMLPISFGMLLAIIYVLRWALIPVTSFVLAYD